MKSRRDSLKVFFALLWLVHTGATVHASEVRLNLLDLSRKDVDVSMGTWEHNILDSEQRVTHEIDRKAGEVRVRFDVDSSHAAMGGYWLKINDNNLSEFESLHLELKAESDPPFSGNVALQFTDKDNRKAPYILSGVRSEWKKFEVPLQKFKRIHDWSGIKTFEIVIDDIHARPKEGVLFLREISVVKGGGQL